MIIGSNKSFLNSIVFTCAVHAVVSECESLVTGTQETTDCVATAAVDAQVGEQHTFVDV